MIMNCTKKLRDQGDDSKQGMSYAAEDTFGPFIAREHEQDEADYERLRVLEQEISTFQLVMEQNTIETMLDQERMYVMTSNGNEHGH